MKNFLLSLSVALLLTACYSGEIQRLQCQNDSLQQVNSLKDSSMVLLSTTLADIQDNLDAIKEKEGIIAVSVNAGEATQSQIDADINAIYNLMVENKNKVAALQNQLKKSNSENAALKEIIEVLQAQIDKQNAEIERLNQMLESKDIEIGFLSNAVIRLSASNDSIIALNEQTTKELNAATDKLQTAYYILGEKSELKDKGVLDKDGAFSKKVSATDNDNAIYTQVNITEFSSLPLNTKKAKILSTHPEGSYVIEEDADKVQTLVIKDAEKFWSHSKYLVIQTK